MTNQSGVDLNRNASYQWGGVGTTTDPCSQTYKGVSPASEPEQQALESLFSSLWPDQHNSPSSPVADTATGTFISIHSYSNFVLLPPGAGGTTANDAQLRALAFRMSYFNNYRTGTGPEILYGTTGTTDDWVYANLGPASYTIEVGPSTGTCSGFTPTYSCVDSSFWPLNRDALIYAAKSAREPYRTPRGPSVSSVVTAVASQGTPAILSATVSDSTLGNAPGSFGRPTPQTITNAEFYVDSPPWAGGTPGALSATDGAFSSTDEAVGGSVSTASLSIGRHLVFVRGRNGAGFWGPTTASFLDVTSAAVTTTTTAPTTTTTTTAAPTTTSTLPTTTTTAPVTTTTLPAVTTTSAPASTSTIPVTTTTLPVTTSTSAPASTSTIPVTTTTIPVTTTTTTPVTTTTTTPVTTTTTTVTTTTTPVTTTTTTPVTTTTTTVPVTTTTAAPTTTVPTLLFSDNFSAGSAAWTPVAGSWSIVLDGTNRYQGSSTAGSAALSVAGSPSWHNYEVTMVAKVTTQRRNNAGPGLFARYVNTSNYYAFVWNQAGYWQIVRVFNGSAVSLGTSTVRTLATNTNYTLRAEVIGSTLRFFVNGVLVAQGTDSLISTGRIGIYNSSAVTRTDDVVVTAR